MSKFQIAELVMLQSRDRPELNGSEMEILEIDKDNLHYSRIGYLTTINPNPDSGMIEYWDKSALRKLPDGNTVTEWKDCIFKPTEVIA